MTQDQEIDAARAQQILDDPLFNRVCGAVAQEAIAELLTVREATPEADAKRRELIDRINTINSIGAHLMRMVTIKQQATRPRPRVV